MLQFYSPLLSALSLNIFLLFYSGLSLFIAIVDAVGGFPAELELVLDAGCLLIFRSHHGIQSSSANPLGC